MNRVHGQLIWTRNPPHVQCVDLEIVIVHREVLFELVGDTTSFHVLTHGMLDMRLGVSGMEWIKGFEDLEGFTSVMDHTS